MNEIAQILELWHRSKERSEQAVLATVIRTRGSSYRMPGARLLITASGQRAGSISGGCLEDDLVKKAWWLTESGPVVRRYDTTADGEIGSGFGLGCNGIIHVYLERLKPGQPSALDTIEQVLQDRQPREHAYPAIEGETPLVETLTPPIRLLVFGAGDDAIPLCELADFLFWEVEIYDGRAHYAKRERFPAARAVRIVSPPDNVEIPVDAWTAAILMTHSYTQDLAFLKTLAVHLPAYLGILGPRKRSLQLLDDAGLRAEELGSALHAPMGLDIGADGPRQVALSVLAEIQAFLNGREGGALRARVGPIHSRDYDTADEQPFRIHSIACV